METNIGNYPPIDYTKWDFSGQGKNIEALLKSKDPIFWKMFEIALPTNDTRDIGHVEHVTRFAYILTELLGGNFYITLADSIFHDFAFEMTGEEWHRIVATGKANDPSNRFKHQANAALRADKILMEIDYTQKQRLEVYSHIVDHDTRYRCPADLNEKILRDSDILWRFTETVRRLYHGQLSVEEFVKKLEEDELKKAGGRFYLPLAEKIARLEIVNTSFQISPHEAIKTLGDLYPDETKRIMSLYYMSS